MMTYLNVTENIVEASTTKIEQNMAWKSSSSVNDIRDWLENRVNPSTVTESTTITTTTANQTSSDSTVTSTSTVSTSTTNAPGSASKKGYNKMLLIVFWIYKVLKQF